MSAKDMVVKVLENYKQEYEIVSGVTDYEKISGFINKEQLAQQILDSLPKEDEIMETVKSVKVEDYSNWSSYYRALAKAISMMIKEGQ